MALMPWATHTLQWPVQRGPTRKGELSQKAGLSWDCRLKPACMNVKLLVTAGQHTAVNTFSGPTQIARHVPPAVDAESREATARTGRGDEAETR